MSASPGRTAGRREGHTVATPAKRVNAAACNRIIRGKSGAACRQRPREPDDDLRHCIPRISETSTGFIAATTPVKPAHAPNFFIDARDLGRHVILSAERRDFRFAIVVINTQQGSISDLLPAYFDTRSALPSGVRYRCDAVASGEKIGSNHSALRNLANAGVRCASGIRPSDDREMCVEMRG